MNNLIREHRVVLESASKRKLMKILAIVGVVAIIFTIAFAVYRHFTKQDFIDDFDDDFDDDYDDDFFMDADDVDGEVPSDVDEKETKSI